MTSRAAYKAWETMRERDEAVVVNLPPDLIPLWQRVKASIRGDSPHVRLERFLQYAEEHEGEAIEAMQASADATLARLIAGREPANDDQRRSEAAHKSWDTRRRMKGR